MYIPTKKQTVTVLCLVLILAVCIVAALFFTSAKFALMRIGSDLKQDGIEGLRPHLSGEALSSFDAIDTLTQDEKVSAIIALFTPNDNLRILKTYLPDTEWKVESMTGSGRDRNVTLSFVYKDVFSGELEAIMVKTDGEWFIDDFRIDNLVKPKKTGA